MELTQDIANRFATIALGHVAREFPHKLDHVMAEESDVLGPRALHPVFFGSFDWHSCVHSWWTLLTLRRLFPAMPMAEQIEALANSTFTEEKLAAELAYLDRPESGGFERPYGWAWLLYLHQEADRHTGASWGQRLKPLAEVFAKRFHGYIPRMSYPITVGTHYNTAFALLLTRRWAMQRDPKMIVMIDDWANRLFGQRSDYSGWEPGGDEFLSPVLTAAFLMSEVMLEEAFAEWFDRLVLSNGWVERECNPVTVSDRSDGKIVHLDGLNLSRAWCLRGLSKRVADPGAQSLLRERADLHLEASIPHVAGDYMGEHWLASFALLALLTSN